MKRILFLIWMILVASAFGGCIGTTQTFTPPTSAPTSAPTALPTALPTSAPTSAPTAQPSASPTREISPTPERNVVITDSTLLKLIEQAKDDLTTRANVSRDAITLKRAQAVEWRDSSLGCPMEGMMYAQVITPGYLIVLEAAGKEWNYHAGRDRVMWCEK